LEEVISGMVRSLSSALSGIFVTIIAALFWYILQSKMKRIIHSN
jgi:hypothetical protein